MIRIVDTGPIIAYFNKRDQYHLWSKEQFNNYKPPFYTCEAVITEVVYQLLALGKNPDRVIKYVIKDYFKIKSVFSDKENQKRIRRVINKYSNLPCDLADACLLNMYENSSQPAKIFTLDSDFNIYRTSNGESITAIKP